MRTYLFALFAALCCLGSSSLEAQMLNSHFGKNRLQYTQEKWYRYETLNFEFHYTESTEALLKSLIPIVEADYLRLKELLEYRIRSKIEIILYPDRAKLLASNVGLGSSRLSMSYQGDMEDLLDHKILLAFDGSHLNLRKELRRGIARCIINRMFYGNSLQENIKKPMLGEIPDWFLLGARSYAAETWSTEQDNKLREYMLSGRIAHFFELVNKDPELAGASFFYFASRSQAPTAVGTMLYLARIHRSIENGFIYVFGANYYTVLSTLWFNFYKERFNADAELRRYPSAEALPIKIPKHAELKHLRLSPDKKKIAWVEHKKGEQRVRVYDIESKKIETIFRSGIRDLSIDLDLHYPLLTWSYTGKQLNIFYEKEGAIYMQMQNSSQLAMRKNGKDEKIVGIERILSVHAAPKGDLLIAAIALGQSDIYRYRAQGKKLEALTNDYWDELEARYVKLNGQEGIVFCSNRKEASLKSPEKIQENLPYRHSDLFFLAEGSQDLLRLTNTPWAEESQIQQEADGRISFLSDQSGILNRYSLQLDTVVDYYERIYVFAEEEQVYHIDSIYYIDTEKLDTMKADSAYWRAQYKREGLWTALSDYSRSLQYYDLADNMIVEYLERTGEKQLFYRELPPADYQIPMPARSSYARSLFAPYSKYFEIHSDDAKRAAVKEQEEAERRAEEQRRKQEQIDRELEELEKSIQTQQDSIQRANALVLGSEKISEKDTTRVDIDNYFFQSEFSSTEEKKPEENKRPPRPIILTEGADGTIQSKRPERPDEKELEKEEEQGRKKQGLPEYSKANSAAYRGRFALESLSFQVDNTPMFWNLDMFLGGNYQFQPLGLLLKTDFTDVFEDYRVELGMRIPLNFSGSEYFVIVEDRKKRLNKSYRFYRRGRTDDYLLVDTVSNQRLEARGRNIKHVLQAEFSYPLDKFRSLRFTPHFQSDKVAILAEEPSSLSVPLYHESRLGARLEYVVDKSRSLGLNTWRGRRFKVYTDFFQPIRLETVDTWRLSLPRGYTTNFGFDFRFYQPLDKHSIFAFRAAGASSWGQQKILYHLGGVENGVFAGTDETMSLPESNAFAFQTLAGNLRGFQNNIRNGNSYFVANAELRIPLAPYFGNASRNNFVSNIQAIIFSDIGTAWQGLSPFASDNPLNTTLIDNSGANAVSPIRIRVNYFRQPILSSVGVGLRCIVMNYFLRVDYAVGLETGVWMPPRFHLAIGTDF